MILDNLLKNVRTPMVPFAVSGKWFDIKFMPSLATGELLNVGVCFQEASGKIHFRLLSDISGFKCLYGEVGADNISFLLSVLDESLKEGELHPPSPHLIYGTPEFVAGDSIDAILEDAFATNVTLSHVHQEKTKREVAEAVDTESVRRLVFAEMRNLADIRADRIIAEKTETITDAQGHVHRLDIPLRGANLLGNVVSAWYSSIEKVENNMLKATLDLQTAATLFQDDNIGLFIMRPPSNTPRFTESKIIAIENKIDRVHWQLGHLGVHMEVEENPVSLAEKVLEWARVA